MSNNFIVKKCERCGAKIKVPAEYPNKYDLLKLYAVTCENKCKTHTFDYKLMKWLR